MKFWGITGTNGKTTTAWIFAAFVDAAEGRKAGYITTVEAFDGERRFQTGYTTPPLDRLKEIYAAMERNGCTDCVMEVSSHAIHQNRVGFGDVTRFSGGAFTNLTEDHLDYHKTMEGYFRVKRSFAERIAETPGAAYVVCLDGGCGREMYDACRPLALRLVPVTAAAPQFDLSELKLVGDYNKSNVLVAAALAEAAGVPRTAIQRTIPELKPRWGRLERVENPAVAAKVYVDFAHTPDGLEKVLGAARGFTPPDGRLWVVFGAGGDRDPAKRPLMGAVCARLADCLVVTSDNPRNEDPGRIIDAILAGVRPAEGGAGRVVHVEPDRRKAIAFALSRAGRSDVVIVAGKGHETTQEIAGVKEPFDDREIVASWRLAPSPII